MLSKHPLVFYLVANVLEQRSSTSITEIFLYSLHRKGGSIDSLNVSLKSVPRLLRHYSEQYRSLLPDPCTGVEHELMVQSRGGHSFVVTATLEHSKKDVFQPDVAVVISDRLQKHLKSRLLHAPTGYHLG